jgi:hypothetical protein
MGQSTAAKLLARWRRRQHADKRGELCPNAAMGIILLQPRHRRSEICPASARAPRVGPAVQQQQQIQPVAAASARSRS